jgi:hypothetical protein
MASIAQRIASELIAANGWQPAQASEIPGLSEKTPFWELTLKKVCELSPTELGIIAMSVKGSRDITRKGLDLYGVHCGTWIDKYWGGKEILRTVATTAIICKIYDLLTQKKN